MSGTVETGSERPVAGSEPVARRDLRERISAAMRDRESLLQLLQFCLVGGSGYAVNLLVFALCNGTLEIANFPSAAIAFAVSVLNNFTWNRLWTFHRTAVGRRVRPQGARFAIVSLCGLAVNLVVLALLTEVAGLDDLPAQALAVLAALPVNFLGNKLWTFAASRH